MSQRNSEIWQRARRARTELEKRYLGHPDVSLIDIAYASVRTDEPEQVVLRIHVRDRWVDSIPEDRVAFPEQFHGFPVTVVPGEYDLSTE